MPPELVSSKQVQKQAKQRGKKPQQLLLDQSRHGQLMTNLPDGEKRGRPDIIFLSLLSLLESPLCKEGLLSIHLHLQDGKIIELDPEVRLPRNYDRFIGLFEQLLLAGRVPPKNKPLLWATDQTLFELVSSLKGAQEETLTILADENGRPMPISELDALLPRKPDIPVIFGVGAFPYGTLSEETKSIFDMHFQFDKEIMMAWHVCAEMLWVYSRKVGAIKTRLRKK